MQTFQSRFTTDISQHQRTMGMFREQTCAAVRQARTELLSLGAGSIGGVGLKGMITNTVKLGAEMQNTRLAFETMMGSARKGNALIAMLEQFADVTPYDNDEVIKSGRMLLNVGVATEELAKKLTMIGDIAAGTQQPLQDMVAIYAKAANKGKVQAEELAQLSERGVPVIQTLAKMLGVSTEEVMKFGAEGKLSFALLEEAFAKMTVQGGQYAGLMEKQSESLAGKWAGVEVELNKFATSIGEKAIPGLAQAVDTPRSESCAGDSGTDAGGRRFSGEDRRAEGVGRAGQDGSADGCADYAGGAGGQKFRESDFRKQRDARLVRS